jgi:hypothetical protein
MREVTDLASIGMLRDRALMLERRAAELEGLRPGDDDTSPHNKRRRTRRS